MSARAEENVFTPSLSPNLLAPRLPVTHHAAQKIHQMIADGTWREGTRLPGQRELAEMLGISRASLREVLSGLESIGVLNIEPGRGAFVRALQERPPIVNKDGQRAGRYLAVEVFQARYMLNSLAAVLATPLLTDADIVHFQRITATMRDAAKRRDMMVVSEQDFAFHSTLFKCCGNKVLLDMANSVQQERYESAALAAANFKGISQAVDEHQAVVDAFVVRDADQAKAAIEEHIRNAASRAGIDLFAIKTEPKLDDLGAINSIF